MRKDGRGWMNGRKKESATKASILASFWGSVEEFKYSESFGGAIRSAVMKDAWFDPQIGSYVVDVSWIIPF